MATKTTGISRDLIIHPGETIGDILEERGITQAELAAHTDVSPAYISSVISGKKNISTKFAMKLEYALGVPRSFWLNLQANYDAELLGFNEEATVSEDEKIAKSSLGEVISYLKKRAIIPATNKAEELVLSLRKALQVSNIANLKDLVPSGAFRISTSSNVDPYVLGAWLRLCQISADTHTISTEFDSALVDNLIYELKGIMLKTNCNITYELSSVMSRYGIAFSVVHNFKGAPVHGYISRKGDNTYQMVLTIRGAFADIFWFSLFHEIGHIVNGDISKSSKFIDAMDSQNLEQELAADAFARDALLDAESYNTFLSQRNYSISAIQKYAVTQRVKPYVVIGRLQKEKYIPYNRFCQYKLRYKWAENS